MGEEYRTNTAQPCIQPQVFDVGGQLCMLYIRPLVPTGKQASVLIEGIKKR